MMMVLKNARKSCGQGEQTYLRRRSQQYSLAAALTGGVVLALPIVVTLCINISAFCQYCRILRQTFKKFGSRDMFGFGTGELLLVSFIVLLLFGKRLPETMKSLGSSFRLFRDELSGDSKHIA